MSIGQQGSALAELRARTALRAAGLDPSVPLERASSVTNEVWLTPTHVVRVNRSHDRRLARELQIAQALPREVGYPRIVAHGRRHGEDWLVSKRVAGEPLAHCWPGLTLSERYSAISQLARRLRALHDTPAPDDLAPLHGAPQLLVASDDPTAPLRTALDEAARLPHVDARLLQEAADLVSRLAPSLQPFVAPTLVHGDVTFENVLWHDGEITAVLDVEWARPGPRDIDLDIILRCCAYPKLHVAEAFERETRVEDYAPVPEWLAEVYSRLFAYPNQHERLRVFAIAYEARELVAFPPTASVDRLSPLHAYHRLRRVVRGQSYLD
ncbi:MAG: aminoglycoside phosphotransferase family protein [Acidimicrobiales bacterium]